MLDIKFIREHSEKVKEGCQKRGIECKVEEVLELDEKVRKLGRQIETLTARQKKLGKDEGAKELKEQIKAREPEFKELKEKLDRAVHPIPNIPSEEVPAGGAEKSEVLRKWGTPRQFDFEPKDHLELGEALDIIDVKKAAKVSGTRFAYLKGDAVLLEFALIDLAMKTARDKGFTPIIPPVLIPEGVTESLGYWARGGNENYYSVYEPRCRWCNHEISFTEKKILCRECKDNENPSSKTIEQKITKDGKAVCHNCGEENRSSWLFLIGTAEHSIAPMHTNEIFEEKELPKRYVGFSTAFRREAGAYGQDTRGIFRVHQFDKVELFSFCHPEKSKEEHQFLVALEEKLWQLLGIPYQVVQLAAGDMSHPAASTIDIEAWFPAQNRYREVSSASNTTNFQARGFQARFRRKDSKLEYIHMLNATGLPIGRTIIAILENYQQEDGSVRVPDALRPYMHGFREIRR